MAILTRRAGRPSVPGADRVLALGSVTTNGRWQGTVGGNNFEEWADFSVEIASPVKK